MICWQQHKHQAHTNCATPKTQIWNFRNWILLLMGIRSDPGRITNVILKRVSSYFCMIFFFHAEYILSSLPHPSLHNLCTIQNERNQSFFLVFKHNIHFLKELQPCHFVSNRMEPKKRPKSILRYFQWAYSFSMSSHGQFRSSLYQTTALVHNQWEFQTILPI